MAYARKEMVARMGTNVNSMSRTEKKKKKKQWCNQTAYMESTNSSVELVKEAKRKVRTYTVRRTNWETMVQMERTKQQYEKETKMAQWRDQKSPW